MQWISDNDFWMIMDRHVGESIGKDSEKRYNGEGKENFKRPGSCKKEPNWNLESE